MSPHNDRFKTGPDVRVKITQHYKEYRPGETYTVEAYVAQQLVEGHKGYIIKDIDPLASGVVKRGPGRPRKYPLIDGITS